MYKTNKEKSDEAADAAALTYLLTWGANDERWLTILMTRGR